MFRHGKGNAKTCVDPIVVMAQSRNPLSMCVFLRETQTKKLTGILDGGVEIKFDHQEFQVQANAVVS